MMNDIEPGTPSFTTSLSRFSLLEYVNRQLATHFPDGVPLDMRQDDITTALERLEYCFLRIRIKYYSIGGAAQFNHLHSDHYCSFLYLLANTIWHRNGDPGTCAKLFLLNKLYSGIDLYYEVELPPVYMLVHPLGTVLGRAQYGNYLVVYQGCSVGANRGVYPVIGEYCTLYSNSSVIGASQLGENCKVSARSTVFEQSLPANSLYIGDSVHHTVKSSLAKFPAWSGPDTN